MRTPKRTMTVSTPLMKVAGERQIGSLTLREFRTNFWCICPQADQQAARRPRSFKIKVQFYSNHQQAGQMVTTA